MENKYCKVHEYVKQSWEKAVKDKNREEKFPLPYDFIPPCIDGDLTDLYYWDTYFTNKGLYLDGFEKYAFQNIEDLKFCLRKFGCVPNMCRSDGAEYASQPPLLSLMVDDYFSHTHDTEFLKDSYAALKTEYRFWMSKRILACGLNRYGTNHDYSIDCNVSGYAQRVGLDISTMSKEEKQELGENKTSEGESGEDHTPRFLGRAKYIAPIDLNCYLYAFERNMAKFSDILGENEARQWNEAAEKRKALLDKYCFDAETGLYFDYDEKAGARTGVYCVACYLPFVFGILTDRSALSRLNEKLVCEHGVTSCEEFPDIKEVFQWGYPNAWAPHQYWAYLANEKAGERAVAQRIVKSYLDNVSDVFEQSGKLFEKYDAVIGGAARVNEYGLPEMLGWTAGVFEAFYALL